MTGDDLVIVIPLYLRISRIARVYDSALNATPDAEVLFVASTGDDDVRDVLDAGRVPYLCLPGPGGERGDYARKINAGYRFSERPFIFTGADDLRFHPGWYEKARAVGAAHSALRMPGDHEGQIGVVGTVDLCNDRTMDGTHSTHSLVARWYADQGGMVDRDHVIYNEMYVHEYCDDELVETARARGAYAHAFDAVVEHLHPNIGKSELDETYMHGRRGARQSRVLFNRRRRLWAGPAGRGRR